MTFVPLMLQGMMGKRPEEVLSLRKRLHHGASVAKGAELPDYVHLINLDM